MPPPAHIVLATYGEQNRTALRKILEPLSPVCLNAASIAAVADAIENEAGLVIITEEVLADKRTASLLGACLNTQPNWSDLPIIVLMRDCRRFASCIALLNETAHSRSVLLLELPLKREVLSSVARTALQNRQRQYVLRDALNQLKASNQTLENFSHTAAHELRNPLGVLKNSFDLLERTTLTPRQTKFVEMGQRTAGSMNQTLNALLDYGKVRSQSAQAFTPIEMTAVVSDALSGIQTLIFERHAVISQGDLPAVQGNYQLLVQLVSNLIKNAIVHNDADIPQVNVSAHPQPNHRILFSVSDNGAGIPENAQGDIFEMFNRAGKNRTDGSGIGLALCRRVVEQHQGNISVRSAAGKGCKFSFDLASAHSATTQ